MKVQRLEQQQLFSPPFLNQVASPPIKLEEYKQSSALAQGREGAAMSLGSCGNIWSHAISRKAVLLMSEWATNHSLTPVITKKPVKFPKTVSNQKRQKSKMPL